MINRVLFAALALSATARAGAIDPSLPLTLNAGAPRALCAAANVDARGSELSRVELPTHAIPSYRAKLAPPIQQPPAADVNGALVVAHGTGKLSQLDDRGRVQWTVRVGPDAAASAPIITSGGMRWVLTTAGEVVAVSSDGRVRFRQALPGLTSVEATLAIPLSSGGAALSSGRQLLTLDQSGAVLWLVRSDEPLRAVVERRGEVIAVSALGRVLHRDGEGDLAESAHFGGRVDVAALLPDLDHLAAVIDEQKLVIIDLATGSKRVLFEEPALTLSSALAIGARGEFRLLGSGLLIGLSPTGAEEFRSPFPDSTALLAWALLPPLIDPRGYSAVVLPAAGLSIVSPSGEIESVAGSACPEPLRATPIGKGRLALSCRSGLVFAVSGKAQ
ncbi:MAG TPA: PQQ-binding-like beta-propeller repeat protein [Polyangiaceae bacterium]|nr:PQQ-binding-like beta-propeller repeat protein [Polyangiaceae bacterium]